jgi:hypothetical protein
MKLEEGKILVTISKEHAHLIHLKRTVNEQTNQRSMLNDTYHSRLYHHGGFTDGSYNV